jgi:hypothetical protein
MALAQEELRGLGVIQRYPKPLSRGLITVNSLGDKSLVYVTKCNK